MPIKKDITALFCQLDDFFKKLDDFRESKALGNCRLPTRTSQMTAGEILTISLLSHDSPCKNFKFFYLSYLQLYRPEFPKLVSYNRFLELLPRVMPYLLLFAISLLDTTDQVHYADSTALPVCHNKRIKNHKVFKGLAKRGKNSMGWFFGLELHLVINRRGQIAAATLTAGHVDDRTPVRRLLKHLKGFFIADKGYISSTLFADLLAQGLKLITGIRKNMKNKLMALHEKILLRKRSISETVFDYLKNKMNISHTRHRSAHNAFMHIISTVTVQLVGQGS